MKAEVPMCARVRMKPGSHLAMLKWAQHINSHRAEACQTLVAEGVAIESVFLESTPDADFLIYYMRATSRELARNVVRDSTADIDAYHQAFKQQTWAEVSSLELLVDLQPGASDASQPG